jgi:hypothetical protein
LGDVQLIDVSLLALQDYVLLPAPSSWIIFKFGVLDFWPNWGSSLSKTLKLAIT